MTTYTNQLSCLETSCSCSDENVFNADATVCNPVTLLLQVAFLVFTYEQASLST